MIAVCLHDSKDLVLEMRIQRLPTDLLTLFISLASLIIGWFGILALKIGLVAAEYQQIFRGIISILVFFLWGCIGLLWVRRREVPRFMSMRAAFAILIGLILLASTWCMAAYAIVYTLWQFIQ